MANDDGCSDVCATEEDWSCSGTPSICQKCGNETKEGTEECDDGNTTPEDGCSASCAIESGYTCDTTTSPNTCTSNSTDTGGGGGSHYRMLQEFGIVPSEEGDANTGTDTTTPVSTTPAEAEVSSTETLPTTEALKPPPTAATAPAPMKNSTTEQIATPENTLTIPTAGEVGDIMSVSVSAWYAPSVEGIAATNLLAPLLTTGSDQQIKTTKSFYPEGMVWERDFEKILTNMEPSASAHLAAPSNTMEETAPPKEAMNAIERAQKRMESASISLNGPLTRGPAIEALMKDLGIPMTPRLSPFNDLPVSSPYAPAITTAASLGIITGDTDANGAPVGTVRPNEPINRAEMATILDRLLRLGLLNEKMSPTTLENSEEE